MRVLVTNFIHARSKMKDREARVKVLKARMNEVRIIATEMGTSCVVSVGKDDGVDGKRMYSCISFLCGMSRLRR